MKDWLRDHKHGWILSYVFFYLAWFFWLEGRTGISYHPVHTSLDDCIPFQEIFIIPYLLWFGYIAVTVLYFFFTSREDYYKITAFLFIGMTICLIIYTIWPNAQNLRPTEFPRDNIFTRIVAALYGTDTSTNVCPSIHVFNSIGVHIAIMHSKAFKNKRWIHIGSFLLATSICLSTVFLKQHSVFDGLCGVLLAAIMYATVYMPNYSHLFRHRNESDHLEQTT